MNKRKPFSRLSYWSKRRHSFAIAQSFSSFTASTSCSSAECDPDDSSVQGAYEYTDMAECPSATDAVNDEIWCDLSLPCAELDSDNCDNDFELFSRFSDDDDDDNSDNNDVDVNEDDSSDDMTLRCQISQWAATHNIAQNAVSDLLSILQPHLAFLPKDARTLRKSVSVVSMPEVKKVDGGEYAYIGIMDGLLNLDLPNIPKLTLTINVDGLPLFKSSNTQLWPILAMVSGAEPKRPFVVGLFCGASKPKSCELLMHDFVEEMKFLKANGVSVDGKYYEIDICCFVCDAPCRAFLKNIMHIMAVRDVCRKENMTDG